MSKRTYRAFIILAVITVVASLAIAASRLYPQYTLVKATPTLVSVATKPQLFEDSTFSIHFFDVGEGDSAFIECDGHFMLIDGGDSSCSSILYSYLQKHKINYLDYVVCTHAHTDHVGGLAGALNYAKVGMAFAPVTEYNSKAFNSFVKYLEAQGKAIVIPVPGDTFSLGQATVSILGPIEEAEEMSIIRSGAELRSTLLKVGHHGSYTSTCHKFTKAVSPEYAVISVGKDNEYGHPHDGPLSRLHEYCKVIYRTDINGEIIVTSDGSELTFDTER